MQLEYKSAKHFYFSFLSFTIHEISNNFERYEYLVKRFDKMIRKNEKQKRFRILCILILSLLILTNSKSFLYAETSSFWTTPEVVSTESTAHSSSPSITADSLGNVYVGWVDYSLYAGSGGDMDIFYKYWNSTTSAWTTTEVVSTESTSVSTNPSIAVDSARNVHISWEDTTVYGVSGFDSDIFYKYWNASSSMWTMTEIVSTESTDSSKRPSIAVDSAANIHVVWNDRTDYAGCGVDEDIFYKCWNTTTSSWTITEVLSPESSKNCYGPSLCVDSLDKVHISWCDETNYLSSGNDWDIIYRRSSEFPIVTELTTKLPLIHSFILISTLIIVLFGNVLKASKIRRRRP